MPDFVFPAQPTGTGLPHGSPSGQGLHVAIDLSIKADALDAMHRSLADTPTMASTAPTGPPPADGPPPGPAGEMLYDVAASALRQGVFFYQVSLPHFRNDRSLRYRFLREGVERRALNPGCDTEDVLPCKCMQCTTVVADVWVYV